MIFLSATMLFGLAAVAVPIIIHILNRRQAKVIDWGAMRFLLESLAARRQRIMIEEIILMALRCGAVALIVLAMARPYLPSASVVPWAAVLPAVLAAAVCGGIAAAMWSNRRARRRLLLVAAALVVLAAAATALERHVQAGRWSGPGAKDVVIVIDGSTSMTLVVDGRTNFQWALDEARMVVDRCRGGDAVAAILAAAVPRPIVAHPTSNRKEVAAALESLRPPGGALRVPEAFNAAAAILAQGHNPQKRIVLITDGQNVGWSLSSGSRWRFLAALLKDMPSRAKIICRSLGLPAGVDNTAITAVRMSRKVVGVDRAVAIEVTVTNAGAVAGGPMALRLSIDGKKIAAEQVGPISPGEARTVRFSHRFERPGCYLVEAAIDVEDDIPADNVTCRVVNVLEELPVLIVEGAVAAGRLAGSGAYIEMALAPSAEDGAAKGARKVAGAGKTEMRFLVEPTVIAACDIASVDDFSRYRLVILSNVPQLPRRAAAAFGRFVAEGGGLWIVPGDKAKPEFYNRWLAPLGGPLLPALLTGRRSAGRRPAHPASRTFVHPALRMISAVPRCDADFAIVSAYWQLKLERGGRVGALLDTGEPLLVERKIGQGRVVITAMSLDMRDSSWPSLKSFLPMVHEMVYHLAGGSSADLNVACGSRAVVELPAIERAASAGPKIPPMIASVEAVTPGGRRVRAAATQAGNLLRLMLERTEAPGLYKFIIPKEVAKHYKMPSAKGGVAWAAAVPSPQETRMTALGKGDFAAVARHVDIFQATTPGEMISAVTGRVPGQELWKYLVLVALLMLIGEVFLSRWITVQRRYHTAAEVSFATKAIDLETFRAHAEKLLAVDADRQAGSGR